MFDVAIVFDFAGLDSFKCAYEDRRIFYKIDAPGDTGIARVSRFFVYCDSGRVAYLVAGRSSLVAGDWLRFGSFLVLLADI